MVSDNTYEKIRSLAEAPIESVFSDPTYGKCERGKALDNIAHDVKKILVEECNEEGLKYLSKTVDNVRKKVVRRRIIGEGLRVDGRRLDEVRPLYCKAGHLPVQHGSMALMDDGIPLKEHVAGLSVGLVSETDPSTGEITDYRILTDILGLEDHLGDMDFKIVGTRGGITTIQLDIKPAGIPLDIICESLEHARKGRLQVLNHMEQEINMPVTLKYNNDAIRRLIGPLVALKRKIEEETGGRITMNYDGSVTVETKNQAVMDKLMEKIDFIVGREIEKGGTYKGVVSSIKEYGAFVEINGGQQGLLHISELSHDQVSRVTDVLSVGQVLNVMCIGLDVRGNINLSIKATLPRPKQKNIPAGEESSVKVEKSVNNVQKEQADQSSSSSFVIRSASECDEEEKSSRPKPKVRKPINNVQKEQETEVDDDGESLSSILLRSGGEEYPSRPENHSEEAPLDVKKLKIGMELTAKVHQIRTHGLVLDLGGGNLGMYRFQVGSEKIFNVGDELRVKCSSFSGKGIPVMSLVQ